MPRGKYSVLRRQSRKVVYNMIQFMKKENEEGIQVPLTLVQKRVALATGVPVRTIERIVATAECGEESDMLPDFRTLGKRRRGVKRATNIDSFDQGVIKRCVHNFYITEKELPTVKQLQQKLKKDINFNGSATSLGRILKRLGFQWKKTQNEKQVLIEKTNIRLQRIEYLEQLTKYRLEGRPIIYTDELCIESSPNNTKPGTDGTQKGSKTKISKGPRVVIVQAGSDVGLVPNALLIFKAGTKTGSDNMNHTNYEKWIRTQLIPNLPDNSVVVVGNSSYHHKQNNPAPSPNANKSTMQSWLREKNIPFTDSMYKPQLYKLISENMERFKQFNVQDILKEGNHEVLRLPPYHPDLNPMRMVLATIRQYIAEKDVSANMTLVREKLKEKINEIAEGEWPILCEKVKKIEEEYKKSDALIDTLTDEFTINVSDNEDGSNSGDTDSSDSSADDRPSTSKHDYIGHTIP